eukprot:maker-scaffold1064_size65302-snap-gene-0.23 protein:Tk06801 transcript:maker-scaffold1064_size65302-snap-gene-0.23-mRNA-1 annotation:"ubiquitin-like protein atg12-like"
MSSESPEAGTKVTVRLQPAGDAPTMQQRNYNVEGDKKIEWIMNFIRQVLKLDETDHLFLYVNQAFSPSPDQTVRNLYDCFGANGKLVLNYAKTPMWG